MSCGTVSKVQAHLGIIPATLSLYPSMDGVNSSPLLLVPSICHPKVTTEDSLSAQVDTDRFWTGQTHLILGLWGMPLHAVFLHSLWEAERKPGLLCAWLRLS